MCKKMRVGVRAIDKDGNRSPVRTPEERLPDVPRPAAAPTTAAAVPAQ